MRKLLLLFVALVAVVIAGCTQEAKNDAADNNAGAPTENQSTKEAQLESTGPKTFESISDAAELAAVIETEKGSIVFEFYADKAPSTIANFITLARQSFYDGTTFHRYEPGFVIQGGDPNTKTSQGAPGTGDPGYKIKAEFNDVKHVEGTVAMARSQAPDSAGSQFYITLAPAPFLDGQYTVFGQVIKGIDVVQQVRAGDVMKSVKIVKKSEVQ